jgi:uncharacterized protein (TIGR02646 family)
LRRISRLPLASDVEGTMAAAQARLNSEIAGLLPEKWAKTAGAAWDHHDSGAARSTLHAMAGPRQCRMYCCDSHGDGIDHFRPKSTYPGYTFSWPNLLLSCTECGRYKGKEFPVDDQSQPLLIDPTVDDPWAHLDFDPETGNLVARYDPVHGCFSDRGEEPVRQSRLDRREAVARGMQKALRQLHERVERALADPRTTADRLIADLHQIDEYGLVVWCFVGSGRHDTPLATLREQLPSLWAQCVSLIG